MLLLLSHGNATVESGFSVNEDLLVVNIKERSIVALRQVYDKIQSVGSVFAIDRNNKDLLTCFRAASRQYRIFLQQKEEMESAEARKLKEQKTSVALEIKRLEDAKRKLVEDKDLETAAIDSSINELKKKSRKL